MRALIGFVVSALLLQSSASNADSWLPAREARYSSTDGATRLTITPRPLAGALPYFEDKVAGNEPAGQRRGNDQTRAMAHLERAGTDDTWQSVWKQPLVNDVGPVSALVANDGRYVVTFDNWHAMGYGSDVVAIYDARGGLIRQMGLKDFLPAAYIAFLPGSVSSIWWGKDHTFDEGEEVLVLRVVEPGEESHGVARKSVEVRVRLADGRILPSTDANWLRVMAALEVLDQGRRARWEALRELRARPLSPPSGRNAAAWREYLVELRARLSERSGHRHSGLVLTAGDGHYPDSEEGLKYLLDEFGEDPEPSTGYYVLVSPSSKALASFLAKYLGAVEPKSMQGAHIAFVGTPEDRARLEAGAARSGANVVLIDTSIPVAGMPLNDPMPDWFE